MALYMIGDVQGCMPSLQHLLDTIDFSPSRDTVYLLGDLVNRGPDSLGVLRWAYEAGTSALCIQGNHDLNLLAVAHGLRKPHRKDTLDAILAAPDRHTLLAWLRVQPLARHAHGWLMIHAGVLPQWTVDTTLALNAEFEAAMTSPDFTAFLGVMYGNTPDAWHDDLQGADRLRVVVNALTRLRLCDAHGRMEFDTKDDATAAPPGFMPWFDVPDRQTAGHPIAFGHWSTLRNVSRADVLPLDSGCVWGGQLSAARLQPIGPADSTATVEVISVPCPQAQVPGNDLATPANGKRKKKAGKSDAACCGC